MKIAMSPEAFYEKYPDKNRVVREGLGPLETRIEGSAGVTSFDPSGLNEAAQTGEPMFQGEPIGISDISGLPGYQFCTKEVTMCLTVGELLRLVGRALSPREYFVLASKFGLIHETDGDFYDPESGRAMQPNIGLMLEESFAYKCMRGDEEPENIDAWVDRWHEGGAPQVGLIDYLGLTVEEYAIWVHHPGSLYKILFHKMRGTQVSL